MSVQDNFVKTNGNLRKRLVICGRNQQIDKEHIIFLENHCQGLRSNAEPDTCQDILQYLCGHFLRCSETCETQKQMCGVKGTTGTNKVQGCSWGLYVDLSFAQAFLNKHINNTKTFPVGICFTCEEVCWDRKISSQLSITYTPQEFSFENSITLNSLLPAHISS